MRSVYTANSCFDDFEPIPQRRPSVAPLLIGGAIALVALAGQTRVGAWLRGFFSARQFDPTDELARRMEAGWTMDVLRESILGWRKVFVASTFGPPSTAVMGRQCTVSSGVTPYFLADTWYYALDPKSLTAMAITYHDGTARAVEFFDAPQ